MTASLAPIRLSDVLQSARRVNASDVHLSPGRPPVLRIDGALRAEQTVPVSENELAHIVASILDDAAKRVFECSGDVTIALHDAGAGPVRLHAFRTLHGPCIAVRLLAAGVPSFEGLGLPQTVRALSKLGSGLVLFTGATGSGKSTALAALVGDINSRFPRHIVTIEDPVEYRHDSLRALITQRTIGRDVASFAEGVYGALRSDPDIILIGEMRSTETMGAALTAAETGHVVLSTLHTTNAADTVDRIIASFPAPAQAHVRIQLAQCIAAVVCLRLLPKASGRGRVPATEILIASDAVRNVIREGKTHHLHNIIATSRDAGMCTFDASMKMLAASGTIIYPHEHAL